MSRLVWLYTVVWTARDTMPCLVRVKLYENVGKVLTKILFFLWIFNPFLLLPTRPFHRNALRAQQPQLLSVAITIIMIITLGQLAQYRVFLSFSSTLAYFYRLIWRYTLIKNSHNYPVPLQQTNNSRSCMFLCFLPHGFRLGEKSKRFSQFRTIFLFLDQLMSYKGLATHKHTHTMPIAVLVCSQQRDNALSRI